MLFHQVDVDYLELLKALHFYKLNFTAEIYPLAPYLTNCQSSFHR